MKKIILLVTTLAAQLLYTKCDALQINLTTGTGAVGSVDAWMVQTPNNTNWGSTRASNAVLLEVATNTQRNYLWPTPPCGKWISPNVITTPGPFFGNVPDNPDIPGTYTYRLQFNTNQGCPLAASMNLTAGGDNQITSIRLNSSPAHALNITQSPLQNFTLSNLASEIVNGTNYIYVVVNNASTYTGLSLCGNLNIDYPTGMNPLITGSTSFCAGATLTFNGNASTGTIQNHFWEIAECDAAGNYTNPAAVWSSWYSGFPAPINFSAINLGFTPQCGKYYKVKLATSNSCVSWAEKSKVIFIKCRPTLFTHNPDPVCEGSSVLLTVNGNATSYTWGAPINQTTNSVSVTAGAGTTNYTVTGTLSGCTTSATIPVIGTPANLDINISTGVVNNSNPIAFINSGSYDDTWKRRGTPGALYTAPHTSLNFMRVVNPYTGVPLSPWVTSSDAKWTSTVHASGNPVEVAASQTDNSPNTNNDYWFETQFNLPISSYSNLRMEVEYAVDNDIAIFLNSAVLSGNANNLEYSLSTHHDSMFTNLHDIGTIATNQSHYTQGTNTVLVRVYNGGGGSGGNVSYMGLLLNAHVKGECLPQFHRSEAIVSDEDMMNEQIAATTFLYPNPSQGSFSIENADRVISGVTIRDALGRVVKTMADVNANTVKIELNNGTKGFYFAEITYTGQIKPVFKKMIIE